MERKSFERYIDDISSSSKLSADEECQLSERIMQGDSRAIEKLTTANLKFVIALAKQYQGKGVELDDLVAEGNIALFKAASKYDASKSGSRFSSYAAPFIHKAMDEAVQRNEQVYRDSACSVQVSQQKISIDAPLNGRANVTYLNFLPNEDAPIADTMALQNAVSDEMARSIESLNEREQNVIKMYFGIGCEKLTMAEIGTVLNLKRERVRQIRDKALRKMKKNN